MACFNLDGQLRRSGGWAGVFHGDSTGYKDEVDGRRCSVYILDYEDMTEYIWFLTTIFYTPERYDDYMQVEMLYARHETRLVS